MHIVKLKHKQQYEIYKCMVKMREGGWEIWEPNNTSVYGKVQNWKGFVWKLSHRIQELETRDCWTSPL